MESKDCSSLNGLRLEWSSCTGPILVPGVSPTVESGVSPIEEPSVKPNGEANHSSSFEVKPGTSRNCTGEPDAMKKGDDVSAGRSSPDSSCSICLGVMVNKSFTDNCMHNFCFTCLKQWSQVKPECPLCKQSFKSIYYNVRSIENYQQYVLPLPPPQRTLYMVNLSDQRETIDVYRRRVMGERAVSTYLDYIVRLEDEMNSFSLPRTATNARPFRRRNSSVTTSNFRRNIYQQGLWVQRQTDVTGRVRESSPEFYRANPAITHRLAPWLNRELNVLCGERSQTVTDIILDLILTLPIRSREFANRIKQYVGRHLEHFVHEFYSYAITPYDLVGYDREATYVPRDSLAHAFRPTLISSSSDEDVQVIHPCPATCIVPINVASDSDDCVILDNTQPQQSCSPEVITLESDNDLDQVGSTIKNSLPPSEQRPDSDIWVLKDSLVNLPSKPRDSRLLSMSININLPGPSHSRTGTSRRPSHVYRLPSNNDSSSDSDTSPDWRSDCKKSSRKTSKKKKSRARSKDKKLKKAKSSKSSSRREKADDYSKPKNSEVECPSPVLSLKKRRRRLVIKSSSDDEPSVLQINNEPELLALKDLEPPGVSKPRLKSVVIRPEIKLETVKDDVSDLPSSSFYDSSEDQINNKNFAKQYQSHDSESLNGSTSSYHSSSRRLSKNRKLSNKSKSSKQD